MLSAGNSLDKARYAASGGTLAALDVDIVSADFFQRTNSPCP
jgi:hypothetical protein